MQSEHLPSWCPESSEVFAFTNRRLDLATGTITLDYRLDGIALQERFVLPGAPLEPLASASAIEAGLDLLHWLAAISYWKAGCPVRLELEQRLPDQDQAAMLERWYRLGLAEFAYRNRLPRRHWPTWPCVEAGNRTATPAGLERHCLVPMGGGKDSLVAVERLLSLGLPVTTCQVGNASRILAVAERVGCPHRVIQRHLDPKLVALNRAGAWNGHVPVTAINAAVLVLAALVYGHGRVVFANERSADQPTLVDDRHGAVNHQFSKSLDFETDFGSWVRTHVAADLEVFSLLRRDRELAICAEFSGLTRYHEVFSSCNRNFHLEGPRTERWCGACPKCHFVFLALAPFVSRRQLLEIFGSDLLADPAQTDGFASLLAIDGEKPFECVGEAAEARAAIMALAESDEWKSCPAVSELAARVRPLAPPTLDELCQPGGPHRIPPELVS